MIHKQIADDFMLAIIGLNPQSGRGINPCLKAKVHSERGLKNSLVLFWETLKLKRDAQEIVNC
jgi:hypothetical protein